MRIVARVEDGKKDADAGLKQLANATWDPATGLGSFTQLGKPVGPQWAGPLWSGPLHDKAIVAGMQQALPGRTLAHPKLVAALLALLEAEAAAPAFWTSSDLLQAKFGSPSPRRDIYLARLRKAGWRAERSHLEPQGVRTDADAAGLRAAWTENT
jgi:tRNA G26 N,N-dimethylase Trm1